MTVSKHLIWVPVVAAATILCTFLPFMPGRYDSLAVPLSAMAQMVGTAGLVLVPAGLIWMTVRRSRHRSVRRTMAILAIVGLSLVLATVALAGTVQSGFALGGLAAAAAIVVVRRAWRAAMADVDAPDARLRALPIAFVLIPATVALVQFVFVDRAIAFSRERAMAKSVRLIGAIELYARTHGRYPASLFAVWPDVWPDVVGISQYHYEPHGDAYNLVFEQFVYTFGTREFVVYNPRGEHVMTSHALDLLELSDARLDRARGFYAVIDAPQPGWKCFRFD